MVERSRRSVGATLAAAREVVCGPRIALAAEARSAKVAANLAGGTHHAFRDRGEGYCVFNDVAIAAAWLRRDAIHTNTIREAVHSCLSVSAS